MKQTRRVIRYAEDVADPVFSGAPCCKCSVNEGSISTSTWSPPASVSYCPADKNACRMRISCRI